MLASLRKTVPDTLSHEIIFVDDGSTDGTREWLATLKTAPFHVVFNEQNLGYAAANNRGVAVATGELLVLLNNDLVLTPRWLEPMLELQASQRDVGAVGNVQLSVATGLVDHAGIFINAKGKPAHNRAAPDAWSRHSQVTATTGACLAISRQLWADVGGFDQQYLNGCEDVDLCLRIATRRRRNLVALKSVIYHHVSASPGRKRRDEANTRRLALRWRDELVYRGATSWCIEYANRSLNAAAGFAAPGSATKIVAHALGLTREPPQIAISAMQGVMDRELARWRDILGD